MIRYSFFLSMAVMALACACALDNPTRDEIRTMYEAGARACEQRDYALLRTAFAETFSTTLGGRQIGREEFVKLIEAEMDRALPPVSVHFAITSLSVEGKGATAVISEITSYGLRDGKGAVRSLRYTQTFTDKLEKTQQGWRIVATAYTGDTNVFLDGAASSWKAVGALSGQ
jgi:ketosteroid isomerase-like protein